MTRLRTSHPRIAACLEHFARMPEITDASQLTGEDYTMSRYSPKADALQSLVGRSRTLP